MKRLAPLRVNPRKEADRALPLTTEKHESRIQHYLSLANVALGMKKKSQHSREPKKSA
jgi:hypothetical protein